MRIELVQHPLDRLLHEKVRVDFVDVVLRDLFEDLGEDLEVVVDVRSLFLGFALAEGTESDEAQREERDRDDEMTRGDALHWITPPGRIDA